MSKKTPIKKTKRRLKRTVRRSLAAVLMITAIGVAAIPVPENWAETPEEETGTEENSVVTDKHVTTPNYVNYVYNAPTEGSSDIPKKSSPYFALDKCLDKDRNLPDAATLLKDKDVSTSVAITEVEPNTYSLSWQFMFYEVTEPNSNNIRGIICKYNGEYMMDQVDLNMEPVTEYYTVEQEKFDNYFAYFNIDSSDVNYTKLYEKHKNGMIGMNVDPSNVSYTYNYTKYKDKNVDEFFTKYYTVISEENKNTFDNCTNIFETFERNASEDDLKDETKWPTTELTVVPAEVFKNATEALKIQYYCEHDTTLKNYGENYTLVSVIDDRPGDQKKGSKVYVAKDKNDANGFLIKEKSPYPMCGIGDKAFYGVSKIVNLTLPQQIGYIGNDAFAEASLMESVTLANVDYIGNRAFSNCRNLATVTLSTGIKSIGAEAFQGTLISSFSLTTPNLQNIGYGAFANCGSLTSINLNGVSSSGCRIDDFAFYNCCNLKDVQIENASVTSIGLGAFAVKSADTPLSITLPQSMESTYMDIDNTIGDFMFAGRSSLKSVKFPQNYGSPSTSQKLPSGLFHGCYNLEFIEFPVGSDPYDCGGVTYDSDLLFADVMYTGFYVKGPKMKNSVEDADPRVTTWDAVTAVSQTVPYKYTENGKEYYEVSDGKYLLCINEENGILTSGTFKPGLSKSEKTNVDLEIPPEVGGKPVTGIATDCFKDDSFNQEIVSLVIQDGSQLAVISDSAFKGWEKLKKVYIGNSVKDIGAEAFKDCISLIDVTFNGHSGETIGQDAFKTGSEELTFHGDIEDGYAPFDWAMSKDNWWLNKYDQKIRVCYKSLAPTYLTVMYNPVTGLKTLLDYPKANQVYSILNEAHADELKGTPYKSYKEMKEAEWYARYAGEEYDDDRISFARAWAEKGGKEVYNKENHYGPWISPSFCKRWDEWTNGNPEKQTSGSGSGDTSGTGTETGADAGRNTFFEWLFEPITVQAAEETPTELSNPEPYYDINTYDVIGNITAGDFFRTPTDEESQLVKAIKEVVVPKGVQSIDVYGYVNNLDINGEKATGPDGDTNTGNVGTYFNKWDDMYLNAKIDSDGSWSVPGLFSGMCQDYEEESEYEKYKRGNDVVEKVTLNSVKYLPDYAFDSCENLRSVMLGNDCSDIGTAPFRGCYSMQTVGDNAYYTTKNGIIYSKNSDGSYTIEECLSARGRLVGSTTVSLASDTDLANVSSIKEGAFEDCDDIQRVDFGKNNTAGLTEIPEDCFRDCDKLSEVILPMTVNDIGKNAFSGANNLKDLTIYGKEVKISGSAFDTAKSAVTEVSAYEDSAPERYVKEYGDEYKLKMASVYLGEQWKVSFMDPNGILFENLVDRNGNALDNPQYVEDGYGATRPKDPQGDDWVFEKWVGTNGTEIDDDITENTIFIAQVYSTNGMVNGKYMVDFYDQVDGSKIGNTQFVEPGGSAIAPQAPTHTGYTFLKWSSDAWQNVNENLTIIAMYSGSGTGTPGGSTTTSGGTTTTSGSATNTSSNSSNTSSSTSSSSSNTSSSGNSSNTSGSGSTAGTYTVLVENGSGSGTYTAGSTVIIAANTPADGMVFQKWTTESNGVTLASVSSEATTFVMPANNVTVTANYVAGNGATAASTGTGNDGSTTGNKGNTVVDITKPGISNKDLATANVNGSTDNFVIKISETDAATQAVAAALTNKYENLEKILYYAMDITLWDSTGTYQLTGDQTAGLSVDITIPIPDALVAYGGNNMAGAVVNGNQLESLNENFTTINGVPCVRFTATHFSPYTIYVDTGNLTEGMLDVTPKTGDPIHPKWFLSIGLACLSIILFLKKDKRVKVKTA